MMPITPISEYLLRPSWVSASFPMWSGLMQSCSEQWRAFLLLAYGVLEPGEAWGKVQSLQLYDAGNTRTNSLHWLATRPTGELLTRHFRPWRARAHCQRALPTPLPPATAAPTIAARCIPSHLPRSVYHWHPF